MEKLDRTELEKNVLNYLRNAKTETRERILENIIFGLPFETLKDLYQSEVVS